MLSQTDAATACGVSRSTIRRHRESGNLPGCVLDPARGWLIPVEALLAAGLRLNAPARPDEPGEQTDGAANDAGSAPGEQGEVARLRQELMKAEHGRRLAEMEAGHLRRELDGRDRHLADVRRALLALAPGTGDEPTGGGHPAVPAQSAPGEQGAGAPAAEGGHPAVPLLTAPAAGGQEQATAETSSSARRRWWRRGGG
ncbi:helix-turn-helix domain-containing protein [Streptomyces platensis]|uniref:helix-turn-helix domain-containing protein n=1 Tax=Streptomyces platensis TaxID=58346 RepID=UPI0036A46A87